MSNRAPKLKGKKQPKTAGETKTTTKVWTAISASVLAVATIIGGVGTATYFWPRIVISPLDPADPDNPFSSRFTVTNNNFIPLTDVEIGIHPQRLKVGNALALSPPRKPDDGLTTFILTAPQYQHFQLSVDDSITVRLSDTLGPMGMLNFPQGMKAFQDGELSVIVRFDPWFFPWRRAKEFRFKAKPETNGKYYWYSVPAN